ncbi:MAG: M28 family peptidase [Caulobacteraceae bacterium]
MLCRRGLAFCLVGLCLIGTGVRAASPQIDPQALSATVRVLAGDTMLGRAPGGPAEPAALNYIVDQFKAAGLEPAGDRDPQGRRTWLQAVPLERFTLQAPVALTAATRDGPLQLEQGRDIAISTDAPVNTIHFGNAPLVFVGYGVFDPSRHWDDFKGADLHGKIAVVLVNDPDFETDMGGLFEGRTMTYFGRWDYKYAELERRGALGVLVVHEDAAATMRWETILGFFPLPRTTVANAGDGKTLVEGWITHEAAAQLFQRSGRDYSAEKRRAASRAFAPFILARVTLSGSIGVKREPILSHNAVGQVPGRTRPNETVVYSAHWDHMGVVQVDGRQRIYHGAQDNASGVADIIALARIFAQAPPPQRTVVFAAFTGEENALLGSKYYVAHPPFPLADTIADLNLDCLDIKGPTRDVSLWGHGHVGLEQDLAAIAQRAGRVLVVNPRFESGYYFRADHFAFAQAGVPALTLGSGLNMLDGGTAAGEAFEKDYYDHRYHHPEDVWTPAMDFSGQAADLELYYALGRQMADSQERPGFAANSDYRAAQASLRSAKP